MGSYLQKERQALHYEFWKENFFPIAMESFTGSFDQNTVEVIHEYLMKADVVVILLSYHYGSIIQGVKKSNCGLRNCKKCNGIEACCISYTHYEYYLAKQLKKPIYFILDKNRFNPNTITQKCRDLNFTFEAIESLLKTAEEEKEKNLAFLKEIDSGHYRGEFDDINSITTAVRRISQDIERKVAKALLKIGGLIEYDSKREIQRISNFISGTILPIFNNGFLQPPEEIIQNTVRCAIVKFFGSQRVTLFDYPNKNNPYRKPRAKNEGVVGEMLKQETTIAYNFERKLGYALKDRSASLIQVTSPGEADDQCAALFAYPVFMQKKIVGAITFDVTNQPLKRLSMYDLFSQEEELFRVLKMIKSYGDILHPLLCQFISHDIDYVNFSRTKDDERNGDRLL